MFNIKEELRNLPKQPGIYQMKDENGEVIYVGKAINLYNRVRSYFRENQQRNNPKVRAMVKRIKSFEYVIVANEVEALVLESNLIKEKRPKYNVLLMDDKSYPYIEIKNEKFPRVKKTRNVKEDGSTYFGPYPNALAVNETVDLLHDLFKIRTCRLDFDKGQRLDRPCLNYFIDRCPAPCIGLADEEKYMEDIEKVRDFLKGNVKELIDYLEKTMKAKAEELNFESAARYRDYLKQIDILMKKQRVSKAGKSDIDLIAFSRGDRHISVELFFIRSGKMVDAQNFIMKDNFKEKDSTIVASFMKQFYLNASYIPKTILVQEEPEDIEAFVEFLSEKRGNKVTIRRPKIGSKFDLLSMARKNALDSLTKYEEKRQKRERKLPLGLEMLMDLLDIESAKRIEAYDISNISGALSVGSMVVFTNGIKNPREYRKFRIKTVQGPDDYKSMEEVLTRRFKRYETDRINNPTTGFGMKPDLIMMDGGLGQVGIAKRVLDKFGLDIPVMGLVKDDHHNTRGIIYEGEDIMVKRSSPLYKFIFAIQDQAHNFAINYHRKLRKKAQVASVLDDIPGVGKVRKRELMKHFKTVNNIKKASREELAEVPQISLDTADNIIEFFDKKGE